MPANPQTRSAETWDTPGWLLESADLVELRKQPAKAVEIGVARRRDRKLGDRVDASEVGGSQRFPNLPVAGVDIEPDDLKRNVVAAKDPQRPSVFGPGDGTVSVLGAGHQS